MKSVTIHIKLAIVASSVLLFTGPSQGQSPTSPPKASPEIQKICKSADGMSYKECLATLEPAISLAIKLRDRPGEALLCYRCGIAAYFLGQKEKARQYDERAGRIYHEVGDPAQEAGILANLGELFSYLGDASKAPGYFLQALAIQQRIGEQSDIAQSLNHLGKAYLNLSQETKALARFQESSKLYHDLHDPIGEAGTLNNIGAVYAVIGHSDQALDYYNRALSIDLSVKTNDGAASAALTLGNIAGVHRDSGEPDNATSYYDRALELLNRIDDEQVKGSIISNLAVTYANLGQSAKALQTFNRALKILQSLGMIRGEAITLSRIGAVYLHLGKNAEAQKYFALALPKIRTSGDRIGEASIDRNYGEAFQDIGKFSESLDYYNKALQITQIAGDLRGTATTLNNIGTVYQKAGDYRKALENSEKALKITQDVGDRRGEAWALDNIGACYGTQGKFGSALEYAQRALPIRKEVRDRAGEAASMANIASYTDALNRPDEAVLFGKEAVNVLQSLRQEILTLPTDVQKSYRESVSGTYRSLAARLIRQGRIAEAEGVLDLLKDEERFAFLRRSETRKRATVQLDLVGLESEWHNRLGLIEDRAARVAAVLRDLRMEKSRTQRAGEPFPDEDKLLSALSDQDSVEKDMSALFATMRSQSKQQSEALAAIRKKEITAFRQKVGAPLARLQASTHSHVAAVYGLAYGGFMHFIIGTPGEEKAISVHVDPLKLNEAISTLYKALADPWKDPKPAGKRLYDMVLARPIAALHSSGVQNIMLALDGPLRYLPLAAVWDGKKYLAESYCFTGYSPLELEKLDAAPTRWPRIEAFASSKGGTDGVREFHPLPNVKAEVLAVVKNPKRPTSGIFDGDCWLDSAFTPEVFMTEMGDSQYRISHIASHFDLRGDFERSALLSGDGKWISLREILLRSGALDNVEAGKPWEHLDLVVLSACNTAEAASNLHGGGGADAGSETDSFASVVLNLGASSVMASLWPISDASTSQLMTQFYKNWSSGITKEEALRKTQLAMLHHLPLGARDYTHPYYWAPFVIYGNWR